MTVKLRNNKVVMVDDRVSCLCCAVEEEEVPCGLSVNVEGFQGSVFVYRVFLGTGTGFGTFSYEPFVIPDRFVVSLDGNRIVDTGYTGDDSQENREELAAVRGESTPIVQMTTPLDIPEVVVFEKNTATTVATVIVYAPLPGTRWVWSMSCIGAAP